ncbi:hypothetical protein HDV01_004505 [Terramyces sp. JEL0728]|nr:hypothetical protein HDV01_004505 [Terramyces sp. JEL0728]
MIPTIRPDFPQEKHISLSAYLKQVLVTLPWKTIFQRVPGSVALFIFVFAIYGPVYAPFLFAFYFLFLHGLMMFQSLRTFYGVYHASKECVTHSTTDWLKKYCDKTGVVDGSDIRHDLPFDSVLHVIIIPSYKEDLETLCETLDILASHRRALTQYRVCLAMEQAEKDSNLKAEQLMDVYKHLFYDIRYTVHPSGRPGEIRGKSSNVAWASVQMARLSTRHEREIVTVMDADTGFAEDYFSACAYHFAVGSPSERSIMFFTPSAVFDRATDMFWSIGTISNLYPSSPCKIPSSAYSLSMKLAISVNFWDSGPEAIGEDMHMYLKCFFSTRGQLIVKPIFSPISSCNIEGEGTGFRRYISGLQARYGQAKRHLWGSLDTGYVLRKSLLSIIAPETESTIHLKNAAALRKGKDQSNYSISIYKLGSLLHRMLEAHIFMGHVFPLLIASSIMVPSALDLPPVLAFKTYLWNLVSVTPVHPAVLFACNLAGWLRFIGFFPTVATWFYYEKYHQWCGFDRWNLQETIENPPITARDITVVNVNDNSLKVQYLGKRPSLYSPRTKTNYCDWIIGGIGSPIFYIIPMLHAQLSHLFTDRLDYKVAAKPHLQRGSLLPVSH